MHFDPWTFAFQCVNFLVLVGLLWRFLYAPVRDGIARRQAAITQALDEAAQAKAAAASMAAERVAAEAALVADLAQRRQAIAAEAARELQRSQEEIRAAGVRLTAETRERLVGERRAAEADLRAAGADLAVAMARRLLEGVDAATVGVAFLPALEAALAGLEDERRQALRDALARDPGVTIATATPVAAADQPAWTTRLVAALGAPARPTFVTEPELIAGVELRLSGHRVACHWAGQLARLRQEIRDAHPL